jgi:hypothetical protein
MYLTLSVSRAAQAQKLTQPPAAKTEAPNAPVPEPEPEVPSRASQESGKAESGAAVAGEDERPGALVPITSVPKYISREEHISLTSTTPASWSDIPPVLHFNEEGAKIEFDPAYRNQTEMKGDLWVTEG